MTIKLDISKAFNRVEWGFLRNIMIKLGFDVRWIQLAMENVCTTSYSMLINGEPKGQINPSLGIKQGDPLSLYLFLLYAKGLSSMIRHAIATKNLHGILSSNNGVCISHLLFANDSFIICQATVEECQRLLWLLQCYEEASGQAINRHRLLFFSAVIQGSM